MPLVGIGTHPTPFSPASVPLPPETGGRGHTSLRVGGWGESQFRRGAYTVVLFICTYFVMYTIHIMSYLFFPCQEVGFCRDTPDHVVFIHTVPNYQLTKSSDSLIENCQKRICINLIAVDLRQKYIHFWLFSRRKKITHKNAFTIVDGTAGLSST